VFSKTPIGFEFHPRIQVLCFVCGTSSVISLPSAVRRGEVAKPPLTRTKLRFFGWLCEFLESCEQNSSADGLHFGPFVFAIDRLRPYLLASGCPSVRGRVGARNGLVSRTRFRSSRSRRDNSRGRSLHRRHMAVLFWPSPSEQPSLNVWPSAKPWQDSIPRNRLRNRASRNSQRSILQEAFCDGAVTTMLGQDERRREFAHPESAFGAVSAGQLTGSG
jgi:hypothetical protein